MAQLRPSVLPAFAFGVIVGLCGSLLLRKSNEAAGSEPEEIAGQGENTEPITLVRKSAIDPVDGTHRQTLQETSSSETGDKTDPADTLESIRNSVKTQSTSGKLEYLSLLQGLTPEEAPGLIELFCELSQAGYPVAEYDRLFWERWAEIDGAAACELIIERDKRFKETNLSRLAISTWAKNDPGAASKWLFRQEDIPLREGMFKGLLEGMAIRDPEQAQRFLGSASLPREQMAYGYSQVARQYQIRYGLESVGAWQQSLQESDPNYELVTNAATQIYSNASFQDALRWADSLEGSGDSVSKVRAGLHARLAHNRPDGLLDHLASDPAAPTLAGVAELTDRAVTRWIHTNPNAMGKWLKDNRELRNYDMVAAPFAVQIASQDPAAALAWADTIGDPELRNFVKGRIEGR